MAFKILYEDALLAAIDKPPGFFSHAPEDARLRIPKRWNAMALLRDQLGKHVYPCHRLDRATSGVLVFALSRESASAVQLQFQTREVRKRYVCCVRGFLNERFRVETPLKNDAGDLLEASTDFLPLARLELPYAVGRYESARYSLLEAVPFTGRHHQIRRHLASVSHPILGDTRHGDKFHNRFFQKHFGVGSMYLKARSLCLRHPATGGTLVIQSRWTHDWHQLFDMFGMCAL